MSATDHGTQTVSHAYYEEIVANNRNVRLVDILPRGIYDGGYMERQSDVEIRLAPITVEIGDNNVQIRVSTSTYATVNDTTLDSGTISSSTPYIILRWGYLASQINYMGIHAIASVAAAQVNDIIVGKTIFSGSVITGFSYTDRSFHNVQDLFFKPGQGPSPNFPFATGSGVGLYIRVLAGKCQTNSGYVFSPDQNVGPFDVPSASNSRIDLVYINSSGTLSILPGSASVSPSAPSYGGRLVIAEVTMVNGDTYIPASRIKDVRAFLTAAPVSLRATGQATGVTDIVAPASAADMAGMSVTLTTTGTKLFCVFSASMWASAVHGNGNIYIYVDGVSKKKMKVSIYSDSDCVSFSHLESSLTPGSHTVKVMWSGTSLQQRGSTDSERNLIVQDFD